MQANWAGGNQPPALFLNWLDFRFVRRMRRLTRFLDANRLPPRIKSGAGFRLKTL
jgi:hypothetical protein